MLGVVAWAIVTSRQVAASSSLALALLLVLLWDPWAVFGRGFWLSFGAVALLLYAAGAKRGEAAWRGWFRAQWAVGIGLMPPLVALTGQVSLVPPLANAVAIPCVTFLVLPLVLLFALTGFAPLAQLADMIFAWLARLLDLLAAPGWAVWQQAEPPMALSVAALLGAICLLLPRGVPGRMAGLVLILPLVFWQAPRPPEGGFDLTLLDVGQGLAAHVRTARHDLLFDTGPSYGQQSDAGQRIIVPYLRGEGIRRLGGLIVSHQDSDHSGGAQSVLADVGSQWLMGALPDNSPLRRIAVTQRDCRRGDAWDWDGVRFEVLHPAAAAAITRDGNATSCVVRVSAGGVSVLLTADIPVKAEQSLLAAGLLRHETVVIAPHHGSHSSSSEAFIAATSPQQVLIPVGYRSRFGHPHADVLERYRAAGAEILRSDRDGAIRLQVRPHQTTWIRWREAARRYWHSPWVSGEAESEMEPAPD
jgi:competence protein ComEC